MTRGQKVAENHFRFLAYQVVECLRAALETMNETHVKEARLILGDARDAADMMGMEAQFDE